MKEELKPCNCGGKAIKVTLTSHTTHLKRYRVECKECKCETPQFPYPVRACRYWNNEAWNTRPGPWIKIESDKDLPKINDEFLLLVKISDTTITTVGFYTGSLDPLAWCGESASYNKNQVIAYMPIPKLPLPTR